MNHQSLIDWRAGVDIIRKTRPTVSRLRRRVIRRLKWAAWKLVAGALFALGALAMLLLLAEALRSPLTTMKPTAAPVAESWKAL